MLKNLSYGFAVLGVAGALLASSEVVEAQGDNVTINVTVDLDDGPPDFDHIEFVTAYLLAFQGSHERFLITAQDLADGHATFEARNPRSRSIPQVGIAAVESPPGWRQSIPFARVVDLSDGNRGDINFHFERIDGPSGQLELALHMHGPSSLEGGFPEIEWQCGNGEISESQLTESDFKLVENTPRFLAVRQENRAPGKCTFKISESDSGWPDWHLSPPAVGRLRAGQTVRLDLFLRYAPDNKFRCRGQQATIVGTDAGEVIRGTPGKDVIFAGRGADTILGRGGNDIICGGPGHDVLNGGRGADILRGGGGNDIARGGRGGAQCQAETTKGCN